MVIALSSRGVEMVPLQRPYKYGVSANVPGTITNQKSTIKRAEMKGEQDNLRGNRVDSNVGGSLFGYRACHTDYGMFAGGISCMFGET